MLKSPQKSVINLPRGSQYQNTKILTIVLHCVQEAPILVKSAWVMNIYMVILLKAPHFSS